MTGKLWCRFRANEVIKAVKVLLDERLKGKKYDSNESAQLSKELCTEIVSVSLLQHAVTRGRVYVPCCSVTECLQNEQEQVSLSLWEREITQNSGKCSQNSGKVRD